MTESARVILCDPESTGGLTATGAAAGRGGRADERSGGAPDADADESDGSIATRHSLAQDRRNRAIWPSHDTTASNLRNAIASNARSVAATNLRNGAAADVWSVAATNHQNEAAADPRNVAAINLRNGAPADVWSVAATNLRNAGAADVWNVAAINVRNMVVLNVRGVGAIGRRSVVATDLPGVAGRSLAGTVGRRRRESRDLRGESAVRWSRSEAVGRERLIRVADPSRVAFGGGTAQGDRAVVVDRAWGPGGWSAGLRAATAAEVTA